MNKNELRLNNYVARGFMNPGVNGFYKAYGFCEVKSLGLEMIITSEKLASKTMVKCDYDNIEPIEITEQWLLDLGFEVKDKRQNRFINDDDFELEFQGNKVAYCIWNEEYPSLTNFIGHCYYVHQLQNLYFALEGKELTQK